MSAFALKPVYVNIQPKTSTTPRNLSKNSSEGDALPLEREYKKADRKEEDTMRGIEGPEECRGNSQVQQIPLVRYTDGPMKFILDVSSDFVCSHLLHILHISDVPELVDGVDVEGQLACTMDSFLVEKPYQRDLL